MKEMKGICAERACKECGRKVLINSKNMEMQTFVWFGKKYHVSYVECKCGANIVLQIDDSVTSGLFSDVKLLLLDTAKKRAKGQTVSPKAKRRYERMNKRLTQERETILKQCEENGLVDYVKNLNKKD